MTSRVQSRNLGLVDCSAIQEIVRFLSEKPFPMILIQDCFRVRPNQGKELRHTYNQILSEIAASEFPGFLASQATGSQIKVTKAWDISKKILEADYALC